MQRKTFFPYINEYKQNKRISDQLYKIFTSEEKTINIESSFFEKKVTTIKKSNKKIGYGLLLQDITLLHIYNTQLHKEVAEKTEHIWIVQKSIKPVSDGIYPIGIYENTLKCRPKIIEYLEYTFLQV